MKLLENLTTDDRAQLSEHGPEDGLTFWNAWSADIRIYKGGEPHHCAHLGVGIAKTLIGDIAMISDNEYSQTLPPSSEAVFKNLRNAIGTIQQTIDALEGSKRSLEQATQLALFPKSVEGEKVLFTTDGELVKIGRTTRGELKRLREYQTGNGRTLTILAVIPQASERKLHKMFAKYHVRGEWFQMAPDVMDFIKAWQRVESAF